MKIFINALVLLLLTAGTAGAKIYVIDGDSLELDGTEVRLNGIDAPEYYQTCRIGTKEYDCGLRAYEKLSALVKGQKVRCVKILTDIYKRDACECFAGKVNLNKKMLESGWAVVYKSGNEDYKALEKYARENKLGMWQGKFMKPELYRILHK